MIVAVHRTALDAVYGVGAWQTLQPAFASYVSSLGAANLRPLALYLDSPSDSGLADEAPANVADASGAARLIRAAAAHSPISPAAVVLVGGDEALPSFRFARKNTVAADVDPDIPTDNPYGCLRNEAGVEVDPELPVGRFAAGRDDGVEAIAAQLTAARRDPSRSVASSGAFALSNAEWLTASRAVVSAMPNAPPLFSSPKYTVTSDTTADLAGRTLFFNLHGASNTSDWYGGSQWIAASPSAFSEAPLSGAVIFACNCYGGSIAGHDATTSIALRCMRSGAASFIGATGFSFGALTGQTSDFGEEIARRFFTQLATGRAAGSALRQARHEYVTGRVNNGRLANRDYKTALQFVFLGDPML